MAKINSNDKVKYSCEANTTSNGFERSAALSQSSSAISAISCLAKIHSNEKVKNNYEANSNDKGVERSAAHAQFSSLTLAISRSTEIRSADYGVERQLGL